MDDVEKRLLLTDEQRALGYGTKPLLRKMTVWVYCSHQFTGSGNVVDTEHCVKCGMSLARIEADRDRS